MSVILDNKKYYYFDNAATTFPKPESVYKEIDNCNRSFCVNAGRGQYILASRANKVIQDTRNSMEELFHCNGSQSCVFTDSATSALNTILQGINIPENGNVYITPFEHNAVLRTLYACQLNNNFNIVELSFNKDNCIYDLEEIGKQFSEKKPDLLVMTHASNTFGFITPISDIAVKSKNINKDCKVVIDGAQTTGLLDTDFSIGLFDYYVFAGHKTLYGPFGVAGFICNKATELKTLIYGGTGIDSKNKEMPKELPLHFEAGSHNVSAIAGLNAALKEIKKEGIENLLCKEMETRVQLMDILKKYTNINIIGAVSSSSVGIVSCTFNNYSPDEIGNVLDKLNICVRTGLHCAPLGHKLMGTFPAGTVRFSVGRFTDNEDLEALDSALKYIKENS